MYAYVVLFVSRNKDNTDVKGFKPRKRSFLTHDPETCYDSFRKFADEGVKGETSRFYVSVSERDMDKTRKALACHLVMHDDVDLTKMEALVASFAMRPEHEMTKKWLFDFDCMGYDLKERFVDELEQLTECPVYDYYTPHGFAVVAMHGFNSRDFLPLWNKTLKEKNPNWSVELKRNAMLLKDWAIK